MKTSWGAMGAVVCAAVLAVGGCGGGGPSGGQHAGGASGHGGHAGQGGARPHDGGVDAPGSHDASCSPSATKKTAGQTCACASECASGFCVDGVCCNQACTAACMTCSADGSAGTCLPRTNGADPRQASACPASPASSCGLDGKCDGAGSCRKHVPGVVCVTGTCDGAALIGVSVCDGAGACRPGPTTICAPFSCDPSKNACYESCTSTTQCAGHACDATGSCGKRLLGAPCGKADDCQSGFCADGVCCNTACTGACVSCALPSSTGVCWPTDVGVADPHHVCTASGDGCGETGLCDGVGSCALAPVGTVCATPYCTGNRLNMAATCDGLGTCRAPGLQNCSPFICYSGACTGYCNTDADCDKGYGCVNNSCGPKQNGQTCKQASDCKSNQCVDGVCCDSACTGSCRSCSLVGSVGKCTMVPAGNADVRGMCKDSGAAGCGANGKCDGSGSCQLYVQGTACKPESCSSNVYTPGSTCDGAGRCVTPDALPCSPYVCNGSKCFNACSTDTQCLTPNHCTSNLCGKVNSGAACSSGVECLSGFCAQGICCNKACTGSCQSCALTASRGTCTNVADGTSDPAGMCKDQGATSCGTNGKCQAGACQKYPGGTTCGQATCPAGSVTFTGNSTCDGAGTCLKPSATSCFPYVCGSNACKGVCTSNADCDAPAVCANGSCGLKDPGRACASGDECKSGFCSQGVCCSTNCNGVCKSCNASASTAGTCTNVAAGQSDPQATCKDQGAASCGTTGVCNGSGACAKYAAGTVCVASSCPSGMSTQNNARTCDGKGACQTAGTTNCAPFACNGTTSCNTACKSDADCLSPNICDPKTNLCGNKKRQGQTCTATADCLSGLSCVDGVCCASTACGTCQACNVTGSAGTCTNLPAGAAAPAGQCAKSTSAPCGNTGTCTGTGACQQAGTSVSCGTASCSGSTFTPTSHCDGAGSCATATPVSCMQYVCGTTECKTSCGNDKDCVAPFTCQGSTPKSCTLKANGVSCAMGNECVSGNCIDGTCCGTPSCPACQACNVTGSAGTCAGVAPGKTDTRCGASTSSGTCGKTNVCDGAGSCQNSTGMCAAASCSGSTYTPASFCAGTDSTICPAAPPMNCGLYTCTSTGCKTTCSGAGDCATGAFCDSTNHCASAGGIGAGCSADNQCGAGRCVDGVCCNTADKACPLCQSCNVTGKAGTCTFVGTGATEPHGSCGATPGKCGNTGTCAADQTCAKAPSSTMCGDPSCTGDTQTSAAFCDGAGNCSMPDVKGCGQYVCGPTSCKVSCMSDLDCVAGGYCDTTNMCQPKKGPGAACVMTAECASGICGAAGVCCETTDLTCVAM